MNEMIEEMVDNVYQYPSGTKVEAGGRKNPNNFHLFRKWGFTIYRTYHGNNEAWEMLLYSLRHQMKLAFGAYDKGAITEYDVDPDDIQWLKDLFHLEAREDPSLEGLDVRRLREFCRAERSKEKHIIETPHRRTFKTTRPRETQGMADWEFDYVLFADEAVLRDVARGEFIVKAVSLKWKDGKFDSTWGWMRIPTGYLLELWHHLMLNDLRTEHALSFDGDEEELENLIWAGDASTDCTGDYSEVRPGRHHYDNQSPRCLS
ncbi:uncharacterized protein FIESC28_01050 [Fusarium coffeatum]|uniref:Uncharacterized protein n=1 Tax=Fusarium coffeatum TaxID=231269 RepID=A0A366SA49_9HYPO|nr:uncharacterized protein FIESC28_01050 [Fusarium coffeatum]RBR26159.1 hypothetical protein FIESC28_01050 [Fusarium coffeatum]